MIRTDIKNFLNDKNLDEMVKKNPDSVDTNSQIKERTNMIYSGCNVV